MISIIVASPLVWSAAPAEAGLCVTTPVTNTTGGSSGDPSVGVDDTPMAFASNRDLTGTNADGNFEIFLHDPADLSTTQLTDTTGGSNDVPSISADGTRIAFSSDRNHAGTNADGSYERQQMANFLFNFAARVGVDLD